MAIVTINGTIATDLIGGEHHQLMKLVDGTAGSLERIGGTAANGLKVDVTRVTGTVLSAPEKASAATVVTVAISDAETQLRGVNAARKGLIVHNDTSQMMWVKYGAGADADDWSHPVPPGGTWWMPMPIFTGIVSAYWESEVGGGVARVTEL